LKTFISDLIPKLERFSQKLDNLSLLQNQHWIVVDEISNSKNVYIFRKNNELLISQNGKVEKAKWEYLGNNSLLIEKKDEIYLFKHGFFDENILALKVDSKNEYAFLINENKCNGEINSLDKVIEFLTNKYIEPHLKKHFEDTTGIIINNKPKNLERTFINISYETNIGKIEVSQKLPSDTPDVGNKVFQNGKIASDGKYKMGFMWHIYVEEGIVKKVSLF